ncbi:ComEA family DNA-binding protein [Thermopolyspora sp. NPDC052614]|uniref:ComEA family DNA-binding protein n=1 Tax=Thermopolyspora sp. NPDC052614 TaxID=3155682 RepID=UPI0034227DC9
MSAVATSPSPSPSGVTVYVTGKVREPGVLVLPGGSRVTDAIEKAGGLRPGAKAGALNLARRLVDGEHIIVGAPVNNASSGQAPSSVASGSAAAYDAAPGGVPGDPLDLNLATAEQLDQRLPGVGEILARRITEYRDAHGGFRSVEQLRDVTGIGDRRFAELRDKVRV